MSQLGVFCDLLMSISGFCDKTEEGTYLMKPAIPLLTINAIIIQYYPVKALSV